MQPTHHPAMGENMPQNSHMDMRGSTGHGGHMQGGMGTMDMGDLKRRFFICLALAVPVLLLSPMMGLSLPFQFSFPGSSWLVLALSSVLYFYGGMPFLKGAKSELSQKSPAMMTLIALGITVAYGYSLYAFVANHFLHTAHVMDFFWELATLIVIMLLGHWIEMRAVMGAGDALQSMAKLLPGEASVVQAGGSVKFVPLAQVQEGWKVLVKAGEKVPADGKILEGSTSVNESMVTGEAKEVPKQAGDTVIGGSQNGGGSITVQITGTGEKGYLAQVMRLVQNAQSEKSRAESLSDKVAKWLFYAAVTAGVLAFVIWLVVSRSLDTALSRMVTVLVIACPHALGLAIPLVVARSTSLGAKNGLLVQNRQALEDAKRVDVVLMDKTGTLTQGRFTVNKILPLDARYSQEQILRDMAALEQGASHPLATGILNEAKKRGIAATGATNLQNLPGEGLTGTLADGTKAKIASPGALDKQGIAYDKQQAEQLAAGGNSVSFLLLNGAPAGLVAQGDSIKPGAGEMVRALRQQNITPVMLTGDNPQSAKAVAQALGLTEYRAGLLPGDKETQVRAYKEQGHTVMMVGDGVNDAPALARANVGVAIGAGTDVAIDSADVVLVKSDPADILHLLSLAKNTSRKMTQNLWWGAGYNIIAIPLAAGVLAPFGILLSPAVGAVLMSLSTVIVALNALTLKIK